MERGWREGKGRRWLSHSAGAWWGWRTHPRVEHAYVHNRDPSRREERGRLVISRKELAVVVSDHVVRPEPRVAHLVGQHQRVGAA